MEIISLRVRFGLVALFAAVCTFSDLPEASAQQTAVSNESKTDSPQPKIVPLLALALEQMGSMIIKEVLRDEPDGLFKRLISSSRPAAGQPDATADKNKTAPVQENLVPTVGYALDQLDPGSFAVVRSYEVRDKSPTLKTGDVFAIRYATNLPGQVRLENIDPAGARSDLGVYVVLPGKDNRIPLDRGIKLTGQSGTEVVKLYFYPCFPPTAASQDLAGGLKDRLPLCGNGPNPKVVAAASGEIRTRSLVNLSQPDKTMSFAGTAEYQPNDVTTSALTIEHID